MLILVKTVTVRYVYMYSLLLIWVVKQIYEVIIEIPGHKTKIQEIMPLSLFDSFLYIL